MQVRKRDHFYEAITAKLGNYFLFPPKETSTTLNGRPIYGDYDHSLNNTYEDEIESPATVHEADLIDAAGNHFTQQSVMDFLINAEISLPQTDELSTG